MKTESKISFFFLLEMIQILSLMASIRHGFINLGDGLPMFHKAVDENWYPFKSVFLYFLSLSLFAAAFAIRLLDEPVHKFCQFRPLNSIFSLFLMTNLCKYLKFSCFPHSPTGAEKV